MSSISIKGVLLGALVDLAANIALGIALLIVVAAPYEDENFENAAALMGEGLLGVVGLAVSSAISIGAGYVAARIAGRGELINGALSSFFSTGLGIYLISALMSEGLTAQDVIEVAITPLLGLLGGYLRLRQVRIR